MMEDLSSFRRRAETSYVPGSDCNGHVLIVDKMVRNRMIRRIGNFPFMYTDNTMKIVFACVEFVSACVKCS